MALNGVKKKIKEQELQFPSHFLIDCHMSKSNFGFQCLFWMSMIECNSIILNYYNIEW